MARARPASSSANVANPGFEGKLWQMADVLRHEDWT